MENDLFSVLITNDERRPLSVSELNADVKGLLERSFRGVWVEGEITNFHAAASGHWYFTLSDGESQLKAACYRGQNFRIRFEPFNGLQVRVRGSLTLYSPRGEYQMLVESLEPVGEGALTVAFEQIKAKLAAEGLFDQDRKRPLPAFPHKVGIVTSPTGAAIHDILNILTRRARSVSVMLMPTQVQGEFAAGTIAEAIANANAFNDVSAEKDRIDVLIVGRGGGSAEDLWAFNEELVARAIRGSAIPVISAVGHEVDFTIADMAADLRAPTPSAAAEIVAQNETDICERIDRRAEQLKRSMNYRLLAADSAVRSLTSASIFSEFSGRIRDLRHYTEGISLDMRSAAAGIVHSTQRRVEFAVSKLSPAGLAKKAGANRNRLSLLEMRGSAAVKDVLAEKEKRIGVEMTKLDTLSPLSVLGRGYSITQKTNGAILTDPAETETGDLLRIRLAHGEIDAQVVASENNV